MGGGGYLRQAQGVRQKTIRQGGGTTADPVQRGGRLPRKFVELGYNFIDKAEQYIHGNPFFQ
jgi:aryl-alcohol dehydrogenase-like predicted oxidoreductase